MFMSYAKQLQQAMQQKQPAAGPSPGANVVAKNLGFHPPGAEHPLLADVNFHLKPNQLGLIIGRSGSGKTTLLQLLAGLTEQTSGEVFIHRPAPGDHSSGLFLPTHIEQRMQQVRVGRCVRVRLLGAGDAAAGAVGQCCCTGSAPTDESLWLAAATATAAPSDPESCMLLCVLCCARRLAWCSSFLSATSWVMT
jgi:hypothetical protein